MKVKIWKINGYKGFSNCESREEHNLNFEVALDARFNKYEVVEIFTNKFSKKHRVVIIEAEEIAEKEIEV